MSDHTHSGAFVSAGGRLIIYLYIKYNRKEFLNLVPTLI